MTRLFAVAISLILLQGISTQVADAHGRFHGGSVTLRVFYDELSPYGEWISCGGGVYGWRPLGVHIRWRPYTVGRWCWTDDGWYWFSDEPWGWATFHYGRWYYDDYYGWIWIPGYDWAPAWVEWRYGGGCIGWAPLSPYAVFSVSWGIHYRARWYTPVMWWNFVDCGYIASSNVHRYVYRHEHNSRYVGTTRSGGSVRYDGGRIRSRGPEREYVEREGRTRIEHVGVRESGEQRGERLRSEGGRGHIEVFRPRIEAPIDDASDAVKPGRVREERGRSLDLDTRKIDGRTHDRERDEVGRVNRSEEVNRQKESARNEHERVDATEPREGFGRSSDGHRSREAGGRRREIEAKDRERAIYYEQQNEERNNEKPRNRRYEGQETEPMPQTHPDLRERNREQVFEHPQRNEQRQQQTRRVEERRREYSAPEQRPAPRMETPRSETQRDADRGRNESGRTRGR